MIENITTFAALKTFYDSGNDLIGVFSNITLLAFSKEQSYSITSLQKDFLEKISFDIPIDVLQTILKRLRKEGFVNYDILKDYNFKSIQLSENGKIRRDKIKNDFDNANREKNALINSIQSFCKQKGSLISPEEITTDLNNFIEANFSYTVSVIEKNHSRISVATQKVYSIIADYFTEAEKSDPVNFSRIKSILYGKIISIAFLNRRFDQKGKLEKLNIYLDTNIIFSLFGFHDDFYNDSAREVRNLIQESGCKLKVFSFTKDEIIYKLGGYLREYGYYSSKVRVNSIYYTLKNKGYSKVNIISFIDNIETKLNEIGVEIDYTFEIQDLLEGQENKITKLQFYKPHNSLPSVKYDLAVILAIQKIRNRKHYSWEKSGAIFLTADKQLVAYDFEEHEHKTSFTIPEVIFRSDMASMFWLKGKTGSDNAFMHSFLTNYMRESIISTNLWNKFIDAIKHRINSGEISQEEIEEIISLSETEKILREKGEAGIAEILNDSHIQEIKEKSFKNDVSIKENEETINIQNAQLIKVGEGITKNSKKFWNRVINISSDIVLVILFIIIFFSIIKFGFPLIADVVQILGLAFIIICYISVRTKKEFKFLSFLINKRNDFESKMVTKSI